MAITWRKTAATRIPAWGSRSRRPPTPPWATQQHLLLLLLLLLKTPTATYITLSARTEHIQLYISEETPLYTEIYLRYCVTSSLWFHVGNTLGRTWKGLRTSERMLEQVESLNKGVKQMTSSSIKQLKRLIFFFFFTICQHKHIILESSETNKHLNNQPA